VYVSVALAYTDGLVERREESLDVGIDRPARLLQDVGDQSVEDICDATLRQLAMDAPADDVALVVVRHV
jgi:serine phosphatase RsbU (regulator of sigma subunit)